MDEKPGVERECSTVLFYADYLPTASCSYTCVCDGDLSGFDQHTGRFVPSRTFSATLPTTILYRSPSLWVLST